MKRSSNVHIIAGGTISRIRPHLALCAPAYGKTGRQLERLCQQHPKTKKDWTVEMHLTKMANPESEVETNDDVTRLLRGIIEEMETKIIFMPVALCDFKATEVFDLGQADLDVDEQGRFRPVSGEVEIRKGLSAMLRKEMLNEEKRIQEERRRLESSHDYAIRLSAQPKLIRNIRSLRKDIFVVGFKTTTGTTAWDQFTAGLKLLKNSSCNLVLANDIETYSNMIITPEEAPYEVTRNREKALKTLVDMTFARAGLHFTRSTVWPGELISWTNDLIPPSLRRVVDFCIEHGAYKPHVNGVTAGHFAVKLSDTTFLTSCRKTNFNKLEEGGLVRVDLDSGDGIIAHGAKPSVGGQSQRIIFKEHAGLDCIVHFHCPARPEKRCELPIAEQWPFECGSHECGENTSQHLRAYPQGFKVVYLDHHGPNIVFPKSLDPNIIINFIQSHFDLSKSTASEVLDEHT